jgi:hypothetical protein
MKIAWVANALPEGCLGAAFANGRMVIHDQCYRLKAFNVSSRQTRRPYANPFVGRGSTFAIQWQDTNKNYWKLYDWTLYDFKIFKR